VQIAQGAPAAALQSYQTSLAIRERLAKLDPDNADWQRDLAGAYNALALLHLEQNEADLARQSFAAGREIMTRLVALSPDDVASKQVLAGFDRQLAALKP
jgi:tetratricopeptide (TPR) repeat protein